MCKAYKRTAKAFNKVLSEELVKKRKHLTYAQLINSIGKLTSYPYNYSTKVSTREQLEHLKALGKIETDDEGKYFWKYKKVTPKRYAKRGLL